MADRPRGGNRTVIDLLRTAADAIENDIPEKAAWRVADAGARLRADLERSGMTALAGLDERTGLGAVLPTLRAGEAA